MPINNVIGIKVKRKMEFQKPVIDLIKMRTSTRSYDERKLDTVLTQKLSDYITTINEETKIKARFLLANSNSKDVGTAKKLGTYGVISGAQSFIVGVVDKEEKDAVTFGYLFEKIILFATDLGIQTCWLGGTFNKSEFEQNIQLQDNEMISIVSPIGYRKEKPRVFETAMRAVIGANKRFPWNTLFFQDTIEVALEEKSAGNYAVPLEMVRLGPSASNKQPWRIIKSGNGYHFFLCRTKGYNRVGRFDMQLNDLGIAMCHFELSAVELGLKGSWDDKQQVKTTNDWEYITTWVDQTL